MEINFSTFLPSSVRVLSGRDYGKDVRATNNLDKVDRTNEHVRVIIPDRVYSVNASFFLGLFGPSVRLLGADQFRSRYEFFCDEVIKENIEDGIQRAIKESNVLGSRG